MDSTGQWRSCRFQVLGGLGLGGAAGFWDRDKAGGRPDLPAEHPIFSLQGWTCCLLHTQVPHLAVRCGRQAQSPTPLNRDLSAQAQH